MKLRCMIPGWPFAALLLLVLPLVIPGKHAEAALTKTVYFPVVEVTKMVDKWAVSRRFVVREKRPNSSANGWSLAIEGDEGLFFIDIVPDSPLATNMVMHPGRQDTESCGRLFSDLLAFINRNDLQESIERKEVSGNHPENGGMPLHLLDRYGRIVVCMVIFQEGGAIQVSGFFIPESGTILTTAHDIGAVKSVAITLRDGSHLAGSILDIDTVRDLALVKPEGPVNGLSEVPWRSDIFSRGEKVFYLGCPLKRKFVTGSGRIETPRNMGGQLLWQAQMEVEPGSSGSPVFDSMGRLAGVIKGRLKNDHDQGFIIPADTVRDFLRDGRLPDRKPLKYELPVFRGLN